MLKKKNIITASALLALGLGAVGTVTNSKTADAAATTTRTIMSKSVVYNKNGKSTGKKIATYKNVTVYGNKVKINGKKYYKIGTNKYVKAVNIDGTTRTLYHNAYIYTNKENRVKYSLKLMSGTTRQTYGKSANIKGKKMYRIGKNQYVKLANFTYTPKTTSTKTTNSAGSNFTEVSPGVYVENTSSSKKNATSTTKNNNASTSKKNTSSKQAAIDKGWSDALNKADQEMDEQLNKKTNSSSSSSNSDYTEVSPGVYVEDSAVHPQKLNESTKNAIKSEFLNAVNNWRTSQGLKPFTTVSWLSQGAQQRADEEVSTFNQLHDINHNRPNGDRFWTAFSNPNQMKGEVCNWFSYSKPTASGKGLASFNKFVYDDADSNWGHRENLRQNLNNPAIGIGVSSVVQGSNAYYIVYGDIADLG